MASAGLKEQVESPSADRPARLEEGADPPCRIVLANGRLERPPRQPLVEEVWETAAGGLGGGAQQRHAPGCTKGGITGQREGLEGTRRALYGPAWAHGATGDHIDHPAECAGPVVGAHRPAHHLDPLDPGARNGGEVHASAEGSVER